MGSMAEFEEVVGLIGEHWHAHGQAIIEGGVAAIAPAEQPWMAAAIGAVIHDAVQMLLSGFLDKIGDANDRTAPAFSLNPAADPAASFSGMADVADAADDANALDFQLDVDDSQSFADMTFDADMPFDSEMMFDADVPFNTSLTFAADPVLDAAMDQLLITGDQNPVPAPNLSCFDADFRWGFPTSSQGQGGG
ncbi:hypothetical protein NEMBOFW57_007889 [Staphylotrichum longicolle]|uniref:Uncharacterized protein n=1 Tax=Staphylotrichum longicolle TaxID=669026 RepID=A0AAD4EVG0_9PEZI|nr:hypothetical protein NEMBOFW57_007889 [Staphylotrichum longicolle]